MAQPKLTNRHMTADEFILWSAELEDDLELIRGEVVAMAPERAVHSRVKTALGSLLYPQLTPPCEVHVDGLQVKTSNDSVFQPDVLVRCGPPISDDVTFITDPTIVIEVLSPSTRGDDLLHKVPRYLTLPSLAAAILIDPDKRRALVYRQGDSLAEPEVVEAGALDITTDDGKLTIDLARIFGPPQA